MNISSRVTLTVNGATAEAHEDNRVVLADVLRARGLTGTKVSCDQGVCGACTVLVDGVPTASCMTFLFMVDGKHIETIEGLSHDGTLHLIQQAFIDCSAFQCGFCTAGMIMLVKGMFDAEPDPDDATVRRWLSSNICRCTGYAPIVRAVEQVRRQLKDGEVRP